MADGAFKDHFSQQARAYRTYRPSYPAALFAHIASLAGKHNLAWDCATGTGQAALGLTPYFQKIFASDASGKQLANASRHSKIVYCRATAENAPLVSKSVDLIVVAQALHWFDFGKFYAEVERVLEREGLIAVWSYNLLVVTPAVDAIIRQFYRNTLAGCWPPERAYVDAGYRSIPFPFEKIAAPQFAMQAEWSLAQLIGYLSTWSAVQKYREKHAADPLDSVRSDLARAWGELRRTRKISWPLTLLLGKPRR